MTMGETGLLVVVVTLLGVVAIASGDGQCYSYFDHAAKYSLDPVASAYPANEIKLAMNQNPMLSQVFASSTVVPTSRPPDGHYYRPVSEVCPAQRFMLKAFKVDGKQCFVIKPEIQQVRYARCENKNNRNCQYCSQNKAGQSKCEETYEWQNVWAYCKPLPVPKPILPHPRNVHPYVQPKPVRPKPVLPNPLPHPYPHPHPHPVLPNPEPQPRPQPYPSGKIVHHADTVFAKPTYYYDPYRGVQVGRWKRSLPNPHPYPGKVEQIALYLPFMCGCKTYSC